MANKDSGVLIRNILREKFDELIAEFSKFNENLSKLNDSVEKVLEGLSPEDDKKEQPKKVAKKTRK